MFPFSHIRANAVCCSGAMQEKKMNLQNLHIFRSSDSAQHISYLYIYVSIECFLIRMPMEMEDEKKEVVYVKTARNYHIYVCAQKAGEDS